MGTDSFFILLLTPDHSSWKKVPVPVFSSFVGNLIFEATDLIDLDFDPVAGY